MEGIPGTYDNKLREMVKMDNTEEDHTQITADKNDSSNSTRNEKRGFRIDDILFSVENKTENNFKVQSTGCRDTSSPLSSTSSHASINDTVRLSPVSFVKRSRSQPFLEIQDDGYQYPSSTKSDGDHLMSFTRISSFSESNDDDDDNVYSSPGGDSKKPRTSFTPDQIQTLEDSFNEKHYLNHTERATLAHELSLTDCQIKTWFQNRRMKMKRQYKEAVEKGYLIPYHPYPFPRYSRLTPAHFASVPALNSRHILDKNNNTNYPHQPARQSTCTCCSTSNRLYSQGSFAKPIRAVRGCAGYTRNRTRSPPPEVLPRRRTLEQRDLQLQYNSELREYFHNLPVRNNHKERSEKYI